MVQRLVQRPLGNPPPSLGNNYGMHLGKLCLEPGHTQYPAPLPWEPWLYFVSSELGWQVCPAALHSQLTFRPIHQVGPGSVPTISRGQPRPQGTGSEVEAPQTGTGLPAICIPHASAPSSAKEGPGCWSCRAWKRRGALMRLRPAAPWGWVGEGSAGPWLPMLQAAPPTSQQQRVATMEPHTTPH